jgi:RNA polymerase sigma factor (sigma-70 family)
MTYRFTHDPESGAIYIRLREGRYHETIPLGDPGLGAGVDVDNEGNVLGVEFLSFEEFVEVVASYGGRLELPERVEDLDSPAPLARPQSYGRYEPEDLRRAMSKLTSRQKEVLRLRYMEGLETSEVADRLGVSYLTVRQLHSASLQALRNALGEGKPEKVDDASLEAFLSTL